MTRFHLAPLAAATVACVSGAAFGQSLVCTGVTAHKGLSSDGLTTVGNTFNSILEEYETRRFTLGVGHTLLSGSFWEADNVDCSNDGAVAIMGAANVSDWGGLNCFNGTNPALAEPCPIRNMTHRWTSGGGWQNIGGFVDVELPLGSGEFFDQTRCDSIVTTAWAVSGDGRFAVGSSYLDTVSPYGGICGRVFAYRHDAVTGSFAALPRPAGAELVANSRAEDVNDDGTVIVGYQSTSGSGSNRLAVWEANGGPDVNGNADMTITVLGTANYTAAAVSGPGDVIATSIGLVLQRWVKSAGVWSLESLGSPVAHVNPAGQTIPLVGILVTGVSADGGTIVGAAIYNNSPSPQTQIRRAFIWRSSINGGVPIDLTAHVATTNAALVANIDLTQATAVSADGNAIVVAFTDRRNTCPTDEFIVLPQSLATFNNGILYLNGVTCDPPRIALPPLDSFADNYLSFGHTLNVSASGSWPMTYQWQKEDPANPGTWMSLPESCHDFNTINPWAYEGVNKNQLRISMTDGGADRAGNYRVVISNACGSIVSDPAAVSFNVGACCIPGNACYIDFQSQCVTAGGVWGGAASTCDADPCTVVPCCITGQGCIDTSMLDCDLQGGTAGPVGQSCFFHVCPEYCDADWCQDGEIGVPDIFCFLTEWFEGDPEARNFGGTEGVPAIFAFLTAWFAAGQGPCTP